MLNVTLLSHTPMPQETIAAAAKLCYAQSGADEIMQGLDEEKTAGFLDMLSDLGHLSTFEHASFTFAIEGVSRSLLAQITRHRIASFSVQSQRYVRKDQFAFITPPEIEGDKAAKERFLLAMRQSLEGYNDLCDILKEKHIKTLTENGLNEKAAALRAEKMAIEDARYVLPNACDTKMMMSMNARSLLNFFSLRCCFRAQWEIRELAWEMLRLCKTAAPALFKGAGPSCLHGACREGKMSCQRAGEVRAREAAL